jgi:hypothetical protein
MQIPNQDEKFVLDIDRNRIRTILAETYKIAKDYLEVKEFNITSEQFVDQIEPYLECNRIAIPVRINLPCTKYPGILIEVDFRKKKVFARTSNKQKQAMLNHFLKAL